MINKNYLNMLGLANAARALVNGETLNKSNSANKFQRELIANQGFAKKIKEMIGG